MPAAEEGGAAASAAAGAPAGDGLGGWGGAAAADGGRGAVVGPKRGRSPPAGRPRCARRAQRLRQRRPEGRRRGHVHRRQRRGWSAAAAGARRRARAFAAHRRKRERTADRRRRQPEARRQAATASPRGLDAAPFHASPPGNAGTPEDGAAAAPRRQGTAAPARHARPARRLRPAKKALTGGACSPWSPASFPMRQAVNGGATAAAAAPAAKPAAASRGGAGAAVGVTPTALQQALTGRKRSIFTTYRKNATERDIRGAPDVKRKGGGERRPVGSERKRRRDGRARGRRVVAASGMRRPTRYWQRLPGHAADAQRRPSGAAH